MEFQNALLDGFLRDEAISKHRLALPDAVRPIDCLHLHSGVPPRIEQKDVLRGREIQPDAASFEADEKQRTRLLVLETRNSLGPIACVAIEVFVDDAVRIESLLQERQQAREL